MKPQDVKRSLIVGAGVMGHAIAMVFAQAGIETALVDLDQAKLTRALGLIKANLETLVEMGQVPAEQVPAILSRIKTSTDLAAAAADAEFALEAVVEVPEIKKKVFAQLEECCRPDTVLASNTSSLEIFDIVQAKRPENLVVTHWFAPPHIIPLVEVVSGPGTSPQALSFTAGLMERLGKKPVVIKQFFRSFIVNRIQQAISSAVMEMLTNGWATPDEIDRAIKLSLGVRLPVVGVVQTYDFSGLDLLHDIYSSMGIVNPIIEEKVRQGHLGAKTSKGMYDYGGRSEAEIMRKRDKRYLQMLEHLKKIGAFEPI